jgi:hypothetical protein
MIRSSSRQFAAPLALFAAVAATALPAAAHDTKFKASLDGFEEVPAISTEANGRFKASYDKGSATVTYELRYEDVAPTQAHIHFGQRGVNGAISVFLCSNLGNGPAGTQPCPAGPATIGGTIQAADVIGPATQGIPAGSFDKLVEALREGVAYVNVHSAAFPSGEARGQIGK